MNQVMMDQLSKPTLATRMEAIQAFHVMEILARAKQLETQGRSICHLEVGEPDFATPQPIIEAGLKALQAGHTKYTPACGIPQLREKIAQWYQDQFHMTIKPERVIVTPGASGALQLALGVLVNPNSEIILTDPGYPCNRHFVHLFEGKAINLPVDASTNYQPSLSAVQQAWTESTRAALFASPANPTGTLLAPQTIKALNQFIQQQGGDLLIDEIYQGLAYGQAPSTALACADNIWIINSFSKYFGMTGWRLGWLIAPDYALDAINRLAQNLFLAPPTPAQYAALAAFEANTLEITEQRRHIFAERRNFLLPALRELGFQVQAEPQGAFYIYANSAALHDDSQALCLALLEKAGVATTPGIDFGTHHARQHVRFAYTTDQASLEKSIKRIRTYLQN